MAPEHPAQRLRDVAVPGDAVPGRPETLPRVIVDAIRYGVDKPLEQVPHRVLREPAVGLAVVVPPGVEQRNRGLVVVVTGAMPVDPVRTGPDPGPQQLHRGGVLLVGT